MEDQVAIYEVGGRIGNSVRPPKTGELIAAQLRRRIVRGELSAGDSLPAENELMEQFEVSRPTLREAFRILESESLIAIRRGSRGARVTAPNANVAARYMGLLLQVDGATVADVYQARAVLEPVAAGMLAKCRTSEDLADMASCVDELDTLLAADELDLKAWSEVTLQFHEMVVSRAGNKTLALQSRVLHEVVAGHLAIAVPRTYDPASADRLREFRRTVKSYRKLLSLIEAKDAEGATKSWKALMDGASKALLQDMSDSTVLDLFD